MAGHELTSAQKMFLQSIMHAGCMDAATVKSRYKACLEHFEDRSPANENDALRDFLKAINTHLRKLDLVVKKGIEEDTGKPCYVAINTVDNEFLISAGKYNTRQMDYFNVLLRMIVTSDEGCVSVVDALNAVDSLESKISKGDASQLINQDWVMADKWLKGVAPFPHQQDAEDEEVGNTLITLGSRAILELEQYLTTNFSECIKDCNICNRICIRGILCDDCECKVHMYCVKTYLSKQKDGVPTCPNKGCSKGRPELLKYRKARQSQG